MPPSHRLERAGVKVKPLPSCRRISKIVTSSSVKHARTKAGFIEGKHTNVLEVCRFDHPNKRKIQKGDRPMKRQAVGHSKLKLCRRLNVKTCPAIGILESLWHLTAREAPRSNIGRLPTKTLRTRSSTRRPA